MENKDEEFFERLTKLCLEYGAGFSSTEFTTPQKRYNVWFAGRGWTGGRMTDAQISYEEKLMPKTVRAQRP